MPLRTWNTRADFDEAYRIGAEPEGHRPGRPEVKLNYHRAVMMPIAGQRAAGLVQALGWTGASRVVVLGCGFGWLMEALAERGVTQVLGVDTSPYIQANKSTSEDADIEVAIRRVGLDPEAGEGLALFTRLRGDGGARARVAIGDNEVTQAAARPAVRTAAGGPGFDLLTESVLESLTDAEAAALSSILHDRALGAARVVHLVVTARPGNLPGYNWKTLEEWKGLLPADTFVEAGSWQVL